MSSFFKNSRLHTPCQVTCCSTTSTHSRLNLNLQPKEIFRITIRKKKTATFAYHLQIHVNSNIGLFPEGKSWINLLNCPELQELPQLFLVKSFVDNFEKQKT